MVYNVHEQVMPESCHYLTALHALVIPVLSPCFLYHPYISHFLIRRIFYLLVSFLFLLHNCVQVLVQKCIRFCGKRTWNRQVIDINNIYKFLLPEAVCCCLQTCNFCFDETLSQYISVPSFVTKGYSIVKL